MITNAAEETPLEMLEAWLEEVWHHSTPVYCEHCAQHAPKNDDGTLAGPVEHFDDCIISRTRATLAAAKKGQ